MLRGCRKILFGKMIGARIENAFITFIFFLRVVREASAYKMYENVFLPFFFRPSYAEEMHLAANSIIESDTAVFTGGMSEGSNIYVL